MADARISGFTDTQTTKDLTAYAAVDKSSFTNMKKETLESILRTRVQSSITWATLDSTSLSFTSLEQINLTINPLISGVTATISLTNIPTDSEVFLKITKGSGLTIAFSGATVDYFNSTLTTLYFRIISIGSTLFVFNLQKKTLGIDNLTAFTPTLNYHPMTLKYVQDNTLIPLLRGYAVVGDSTGGLESIALTFTTVGTTDYMVVGAWKENATGLLPVVSWKTRLHTATGFTLDYAEAGTGVSNFTFYFYLLPLTSFIDVTPT
jgi:hypothetical protein